MTFKSEHMSISEATDLLIEEVAKRPILWHQQHVNQREIKAVAWTEVAKILKIPEEAIRPKWKNLRDIWTKEYSRVKSCENYTPTWKYYQGLMFLKEMNNPEAFTKDIIEYSLESNGHVEALDSDISDDDDSIIVDPIQCNLTEPRYFKEELFDKHDEKNCLVEVAHSPKPITSKTKKRIKRNDDDNDDTEYDFMYLKSLIPYFKMIDPMRKLIVRSKIQDILMKELSAKRTNTFKDHLS